MNKFYTKAELERTEKGLLAVATTAVEDRHGEVVSVEGWDTKSFKKNPVLLWAHDHTIPAIGIAKNLKIDGVGKKARMVFEPVFHELTDQAKALKAMVDEGIVNSFSVGFRPLEMDGNMYTKQELLEISLVNVPANPDARMLAYKALQNKGFSEDTIKSVVDIEDAPGEEDEEEVETTYPVEEVKELKAIIAQQGEQIEELVKGLQHLNPQGRKSAVVTERLALAKVVARAADQILRDNPKPHTASLAKVVKRATEKLIVDHKQELKTHGKN